MCSEGSRHAAITPDDHGAVLAMSTWFLGGALVSKVRPTTITRTDIAQVLCVFTRLVVRFTTQRWIPGVDDILIVVSAVSVQPLLSVSPSI